MLVLDRASPNARAGRVGRFLSRHRIATAVVLTVIAALVVVDVRLFVVPTSQKPARTDAIIVLGGPTFTSRLDAALRLAERYPGTPLVVSTPGQVPCPDDVPATTPLTCFRPSPSSTQGEARAAAAFAAQHGWTSLSVVTTADQIWRARLRFSRCYDGELRMIQAPTSAWTRVSSVPYEMGATVKAEVFQRGC